MSMSGSAGFSGGFLPVAAFHVLSSVFRVRAAAPSAAANEKIDHTLELSDAMLRHYPAGALPFGPAAGESAVRAPARSSGWRLLSSQYGVGSAGSVISTLTARLR